jgi:replicative DNA helicase
MENKIKENFLKKIKENQILKKEGGFNCIPFPFERFSKKIPGIIQGQEITISANSGIGKSMISKYMFIFHPFLWCRENKQSGITVKILAFLLEETRQEFLAIAYSFFLKHFYNITISPTDISSMRENPLSDFVYNKMLELDNIMDEFLDVVIIEDNISNPTGIYKSVQNYAELNGQVYLKEIKIDGNKTQVFDYYIPNKPKEYVLTYTDHISLLQPEKGLTLHQTISLFSAEYCRKKLSKRYNITNIRIQQQSAASENQQFDNRGNNIYSKLEPSLADLADNKLTQRDCHLILGLFSPDRYEIPNYLGFDIYEMRDNYRCLSVLKNRNGISNMKVSLYFDGATCNFKELPVVSKNENGEFMIGEYTKGVFFKKYKENKEFWFNNNKLF